jgi:DNA-binding CsgD family transcriptional regulator
MNLPAGLIDNNIEFFRDPQNPDFSWALFNMRVVRVKDLPAEIKTVLWCELLAHPIKLSMLYAMGFNDPDAALEKYFSCSFGAFDHHPDYSDGKFSEGEYIPCPIRSTCPGNGILCRPLTVGDGKELSPREVDILELAGQCKLNKEIAAELGISPETVKKHVKHIQEKSGLMNKKDLVSLAHQVNLVQ